MRAYCKKLMAIFLAVLFLTAPAQAAGARFSDVPAGSAWYQDVEYIAQRGITSGTGGGCYSPEAPITAGQWAIMLCRAFGPSEGLPQEGELSHASLTFALRQGWLSAEALARPDTRMCRGALYESAFYAAGLAVYDSLLYPEGQDMGSYENCLRIGAELGLCAQGEDPLELVTRGEAAHLLHALLTQEFEIEEPPVLASGFTQNDEAVSMNSFLLALRDVPEPILTLFQREGWIYTVNFQYLADLSVQYGANCIGATDYSAKRIYVAQAEATLHEFGHFLDWAVGFPSRRETFFQEEAQAASAFLREYALTSSQEYFAEYFAYWVKYQGQEERATQMRLLTPDTYAFFTRLAAGGWQTAGL